jgi:hypothetical protein
MASGAAIAAPIWARKIVAKRYALNEQYESCLMDVVNTACMIPQKHASHLMRVETGSRTRVMPNEKKILRAVLNRPRSSIL